MTTMAAAVKELIAAGVTGDALVMAVERMESASKAERSSAAIRQARYRARLKAERDEAITRDATCITRDAQKEIPPTPPKEKLPLSSSDSTSEDSRGLVVARARRTERANRLPDDWRPDEADLRFAATVLPPQRIPVEVEQFRDYWHARAGPNAVKRSWAAAWRTWCRRAADYQKSSNGNGKRTVIDAADDLLAKVRSFDEPAPRELRDGTSAPNVRLLSSR